SGVARHDGAVQGAVGSADGNEARHPFERVALVREDQATQGGRGVTVGVAAGFPRRGGPETGDVRLGPVPDLGTDHVSALDEPSPAVRGDQPRAQSRAVRPRWPAMNISERLRLQPVTTPDDPVRVRGDVDAPSRWLWLVKWCVLAVPHYPILI